MVKEEQLDIIFRALSDSTRRGILSEVAKGNPTVGEIGRPFPISGPAISKHLKMLERAQLVTRIREGTTNRFRLNMDPFREVDQTIRRLTTFWQKRLDAIGEIVENNKEDSNYDK